MCCLFLFLLFLLTIQWIVSRPVNKFMYTLYIYIYILTVLKKITEKRFIYVIGLMLYGSWLNPTAMWLSKMWYISTGLNPQTCLRKPDIIMCYLAQGYRMHTYQSNTRLFYSQCTHYLCQIINYVQCLIKYVYLFYGNTKSEIKSRKSKSISHNTVLFQRRKYKSYSVNIDYFVTI